MKMNKLKEYFLKDLYEISSGISTKPEQAGYGYPFISFRTIFNNWILPNELNDLMNTSEIEREKYSIKKGDILLTRTSEKIDELAMSSVALKDYENTTFSGFAKRLRPTQTDITYDKFMAFFLRSSYFREIIDKKTTMTLRASFNETLFSQIKILLPEYKTQVKIGELLCKMEEKIKLNNKINSELENMAKTIYDYWFLQFEFPNDKGKPYKSSGGKMVWNEELKKEIPDGFKIENLENFCRIFTGKKDVNQALEKGKYKFFSCSPNYKYSNEKIYEGKAILISGNGSYTGRTILVNDAIDLYQRTYACVLKNNLNCIEYFYYTLLKFFVPIVSGGTHGSTIPYIIYDDIAKQKIIINENIIEKFKKIISPIQNKIFQLKNENEELTSLRDYLLPLLINGQVGFKD